jgi:hypothetical protein
VRRPPLPFPYRQLATHTHTAHCTPLSICFLLIFSCIGCFDVQYVWFGILRIGHPCRLLGHYTDVATTLMPPPTANH